MGNGWVMELFLSGSVDIHSAVLLFDRGGGARPCGLLCLLQLIHLLTATLRCHDNVMQTEWGGPEEGGPA